MLFAVHPDGAKRMPSGRSKATEMFAFVALACALSSATSGESSSTGSLSGARTIEFQPSGIRYGSVALSPRRDLLACERVDHDRRAHDILILPLERPTDSPRIIVADGRSPLWLSEDRILFYRDDAQGNADLWITSVAGTSAHALTQTPALETGVSIAPDHRRLLVARATPLRDHGGLLAGWTQPQIVLAEVRDDTIAEVAVLARGDAARGDPSSPRWSPDGRRFVYVRETRRGARNDLYVMNADGSDDRLLARDAVPLAWSPDALSVYFQRRSRTDSNGEVRRIRVDDSVEHLVLADTYVPPARFLDAQWNTRGDRLVLSTAALVDVYDAAGFRDPTGIVVLDAAGTVITDLRQPARREEIEGGAQWDANDRIVFSRHTALQWSGSDARGGVVRLNPVTGEESTVLADTERYVPR